MAAAQPQLERALGFRDLVFFNVAAVTSIRWLATAAHIGPAALVLWVGAAACFFVPLALAVAALNERYPEEGGVYVWTARYFGPWHGFLCGWCYWLSNFFYLPNLLLSGIGIALYTLGPGAAARAENPLLVAGAALAVQWLAVAANLLGWRTGKWTQNLGAAATCAAGGLIVAFGVAAILSGRPATPLDLTAGWNWATLNFWPQLAFAFGGLELGAILSGEIRDSQRTVRRAAWLSALLIGGFYILGTLAILALLPPQRISIVTGLAQVGVEAGARFGFNWAPLLLAGLAACGILGQFGAWMSGSARLAFRIGVDRYLPPRFAALHPRWRTPYVALLTQGVACTVFLIVMQAGESLRTGFQLLVDMTVVSYFLPFVYLFACAWRQGLRWSAAAGLLVTAAAIVASFIPPGVVASVFWFEAKLAGGCLLLIGSGWWTFRRRA